jgi:hypothetical protein
MLENKSDFHFYPLVVYVWQELPHALKIRPYYQNKET